MVQEAFLNSRFALDGQLVNGLPVLDKANEVKYSEWSPTGKPVVPFCYPSSPSATPWLSATIPRATSRRSEKLILDSNLRCISIHPRASPWSSAKADKELTTGQYIRLSIADTAFQKTP